VRRTEFLRQVTENVVNRESSVQDHSTFTELHPIFEITETTGESYFIPVELEHISRSTDSDDTLSTFSRFDCTRRSLVRCEYKNTEETGD